MGIAWVTFPDQRQAQLALDQENGRMIGHRYVDIFPSGPEEIGNVSNRSKGTEKGANNAEAPSRIDHLSGGSPQSNDVASSSQQTFAGTANWNSQGQVSGATGIAGAPLTSLPQAGVMSSPATSSMPVQQVPGGGMSAVAPVWPAQDSGTPFGQQQSGAW